MSLDKPLPTNRRLAPKPGRVVQAPGEPMVDGESPPPGATATTVRPPPKAKRSATPKAPRGPLLGTLQLAAGALVVLAASIAVAWGARRYVLSSPRFAVRTVQVEGVRKRSADSVAKSGGIVAGKNIFALDLELAKASILTDPWIESAAVTRKLPGTIHVSVVEREVAALAVIGGELYLATRDGDLFKKMSQDDAGDLVVVTGITPEQVAADRAGAVLAVKRALDVGEELEKSGLTKQYPVQELHVEKDGGLVAFIGKSALAVHFGHPPHREKIEQLRAVLYEVARRKADASIVFLDNDAHPERVVVRMR